MDDPCQCHQDLELTPSPLADNLAQDVEVIESVSPVKGSIDFGKVEVSKKKWQRVQIQNDYQTENLYQITRDPSTNPTYQTFGASTYQIAAAPKSVAEFKIFFNPLFANAISIDQFEITDVFNNKIHVHVRGEGKGPVVQSSVKQLKFFAWDEQRFSKQTIELANKSDLDATFFIDTNERNSYFRVDKVCGVVKKRKYTFITITFKPPAYGIFSYQLDVLVMYHQPIIITLFGIYSKEKPSENVNLCFGETNPSRSYAQYMKDVQFILEGKPTFSLSTNYFNFGTVVPGPSDGHPTKTMVTSLTNHATDTIKVIWENDKNFSVVPKSVASIPPDESVLFECVFKVDKEEFIFSRRCIGNVYWKDREEREDEADGTISVAVPLVSTLRFLGTSFHDKCFWIPQLELTNEVIVLPPALPNDSSYTTFRLSSDGYLPVAFQFIAPKKTKFIVKPMLGIVKDYHLVVVQVLAELQGYAKFYMEKWGVELNGQSDHTLPLYFKGFSQAPSAVVGNKNVIVLPKIQNECIHKFSVPIKNTCQHYLKYEFIIKEEDQQQIELLDNKGSLAANETIVLNWTYRSRSNAFIKHCVKCVLYVLEEMVMVVGTPTEVTVDIYAECSYSELCCIPNKCDLGEVECHTSHQTVINLYNFGTTDVHFQLYGLNEDETPNHWISTMPTIGTVKAGGEQTVVVQYTPDLDAQVTVKIFYRVRKEADSSETVANTDKQLLVLTCTSLYPVIQITDIADHNFGPLFSKRDIWDMLGIDRFNQVVKQLKKDDTASLNMFLPDFELDDKDYYIIFILRNLTGFRALIDLKRLKVCDCKLEEVPNTISIRKRVFNCPHREVFQLAVQENVVEPNSYQTLIASVKYNLKGVTFMSYCMTFAYNRTLILDFVVKVLYEDFRIVSNYRPEMFWELSNVCLSEFDPALQFFWLYNNTEKDIEFEIMSTDCIRRLNEIYDSKVMVCYNKEGIVPKYSTIPLIFKYLPIDLRQHFLSLPVRMGDVNSFLQICGQGKKRFVGFLKPEAFPYPSIKYDTPIALSENHIAVDPFPVWSNTQRMVFIKNLTKDMIGYSWQSCIIDGLIEAKLPHRKGVLHASESHALLVNLQSFGKPCKIRLQLACKLLNHNEYYEHKYSVLAYNKRQQEIENEFIITEQGITYPENEIIIKPKPTLFFVSLSMDVIVSSITDRDLHHTAIEQCGHSQKYNLSFENANGERAIEPTMDPFKVLETQQSLLDDETEVKDRQETQNFSSQNADELNRFKFVEDCIIADAVFSSLFKHLVQTRPRTRLCYSQVVCDPADRSELVKNLYNNPQPPLVSKVLQEVITDSVHEMFKLGPRAEKLQPANLAKEIKFKYKLGCLDDDCPCD